MDDFQLKRAYKARAYNEKSVYLTFALEMHGNRSVRDEFDRKGRLFGCSMVLQIELLFQVIDCNTILREHQ